MHRITSQDFSGVRAGWTHEQTYTYLNVDRRTYERWLSGRSRIPFMAYELLRIVVAGQLPATARTGAAGDFMMANCSVRKAWPTLRVRSARSCINTP